MEMAGEGLPLELTPEETNQMFSGRLNRHFGFDAWGHGFNVNVEMIPPFDEQVPSVSPEAAVSSDARRRMRPGKEDTSP